MRDLVSTVLLARAQEQSDAALHEPAHWEPEDRQPHNIRTVLHGPQRSRCLAGDCARRVKRGSYCEMHFARLRRHGTVEELIKPSVIVKHARRLTYLRRAA